MGKQIQIVGQNVRPVVLKELDLNANGIFTFLKPSEDDVVEVNNSEFIRAVKDIDTFNKWVVEYKRDENTIIPLRIDKIEKKVIEPSSSSFVELSINAIKLLENGNYKIDFDGTLTKDTEHSYVVGLSVQYGGSYIAIGYGTLENHGGAYININDQLADGDITIKPISEEYTEESASVKYSRLLSANKDGDKLTLELVPWGEEVGASDGTPKTEWHYYFTNDDVDVSAITLVKLEVVYTIEDDSIVATYVDETKEIEAGTVLPTPSGADDGKVLGVEDGAYALVEQSGGGSGLPVIDLGEFNYDEALPTLQDVYDENTTLLSSRNILFILKLKRYNYPGDQSGTTYYGTFYIDYWDASGGAYYISGSIVRNSNLQAKYFNNRFNTTDTITIFFEALDTMLNSSMDLSAYIKMFEINVPYMEQYTFSYLINCGAITDLELDYSFFVKNTGGSPFVAFVRYSGQRYGSTPKIYVNILSGRYGSSYFGSAYYNNDFTQTITENDIFFDDSAIIKTPLLPNDASTKTYVLKAVNGVLTWVEEQA